MGAKVSPELHVGRELGEEAPVDLIEVAGVIKWFDASKGTASSSPTAALPDVLLHVTCLRRGGFQTAYEGARVVCEVLEPRRRACRPSASSAWTSRRRSARRRRRRRARTTRSRRPAGSSALSVKWFNRVRGYGFLTRGEGTEDIFVHMETLRRYGLTELRPGQVVLVRFGDGPKGLMAAEIRPDGAAAGRPRTSRANCLAF